MQVTRPGPGYVHFSNELSDEWFRQMAGEVRTARLTAKGEESKWVATRKRVEAWDCTVYAVWLETHFDLARKPAKYWAELAEKVQPAVGDLFAAVPAAPLVPAPNRSQTVAAPVPPADIYSPIPIADTWN
jgi:phage terminase large subunit GpA-like protein